MESVLFKPVAVRFKPAATIAILEGEGISGVAVPSSGSNCLRFAVGGLSPLGEWVCDVVLRALVEARGVAGAVSGNSGGDIFIGRGNNDFCFFSFRRNPNLVDGVLDALYGFGVCSNETWPAELASERDESDTLGTEREDLASRLESGRVSRAWLVDNLPGSSTGSNNVCWLLINPNGPRLISVLFLSIEVRISGCSADEGSNERRRKLNCCSLPRRFGMTSSLSTTVGAVVMIEGVAAAPYVSGAFSVPTSKLEYSPAGIAGTGGACSFALTDNCESEAWRNRIKLKRRVFGVDGWMGGDGGASLVLAEPEGRAMSVEVGRRPSSETATRSGARCSTDLFTLELLSPRRKRLAGSRVLRRWRSRSLRFGRRALKGIAGAKSAIHVRSGRRDTGSHGTVQCEETEMGLSKDKSDGAL